MVKVTGHYVHAKFTSRFFRFVDDVEFCIDDDLRIIHVRSSSRVGYFDFGVNRRRVERIRAKFAVLTTSESVLWTPTAFRHIEICKPDGPQVDAWVAKSSGIHIGGFSKKIAAGHYANERLAEYTGIIFEEAKRLDKALSELLVQLEAAAHKA
jgi:hypothetical protein